MSRFALLVVVAALTAFGQPSAKLPEFEVASIRPAALNDTRPREGAPDASIPSLGNAQSGRNLSIANQGLRSLIALAYGVGVAQVVAPQWERDPDWQTNHFDIVAKVPPDGTREQLPLML